MQNNKTHCIKQFKTEGMPTVIAKKVSGLVNILNSDFVSFKKLQAFLAEGIPDQAAILRQYCWKIILGFLPQQKNQWQSKIQKQVKTYEEFVKQFLPQQKFPQYPIILNKNHPRWLQLQQDFLLWQQIQKDTSRTHAQLSFFATPASQILIPYLTSPRRQKFRLIHGQNQGQYKAFLEDKQKQRRTYRYDYMTRILYIYAKLNPRIQYVQGMNEILAPIFYIVNSSKPPNSLVEEASCFFMFNNAISDIIQLHIKDLDKSENGIYGKLNNINRMLVVIQPRIWSTLQKLKIDPFYYCFRWMTLLFAQDFALFDVLRIWESIFSAQNRLDYMNYFAIAIIITAKQFILNHDFVEVLSYLQNIGQTMDLGSTLLVASQLYYEFRGHDFMAHSQMTKKALKKKQEDKDKKNTVASSFTKISKFFKNIL